jgi:ribosomal protein S18 acetylase RimI-like enzyme
MVEPATREMYDEIRALDRLLPGLRDRAEPLRQWIAANECWVARRDGQVAGFVIANCTFFAQCFIVLLVVHPEHRRHRVASALIRHVESISPTAKLFTSTNQSNVAMQAVCEALGFVRSGIVENLDEDDPELIYFKRVRP